MYKSQSKIVSRSVKKLLKYRILLKDIITFLRLDYRDALLIILNFVALGISIPKFQSDDFIT